MTAVKYSAFSPADNGELIAEGQLDIPEIAELRTKLDLLEKAVEDQAKELETGAQIRVLAWRVPNEDVDPASVQPFISHCWDLGNGNVGKG